MMDDKPLYTPYLPKWLRQDWKPNIGGVKQTERIRAKKIGAKLGTASRMAYRRWTA